MARIEPLESPQGKSGELLEAVQKKIGLVPNIFKTMGKSPATLEGFLGLSGALTAGTLSADLREQIALTCAGYNGCSYCTAAHSLLAHTAGVTEIEEALQGTSSDPKTQAALTFSLAILEKKGQIDDNEFKAVTDAGYSEEEVIEIVANVCVNVFTNYFNEVCKPEIDFPVF